MSQLAKEIRKIQRVIFDRYMQSRIDPNEARLLEQASIAMPKDPIVVVVDSDLAYGNARALAIDLSLDLGKSSVLFIAQDSDGLKWATNVGLNAYIFNRQSTNESAFLWNALIRARVSIYDSHNWWHTYDQLLLRSLLAGSKKIQLWHGATGPVGKVFGLERLASSKTFWHFVMSATSSGPFDYLVNEPSQAEYRRSRSYLAAQSIHDVEYRLVQMLKAEAEPRSGTRKILIAPTFSETTAGEDMLARWINALCDIAVRMEFEVDISIHPGAKPRLQKLIKNANVSKIRYGIPTTELREYALVVTDFSGIAHDSIMCDIPTMSVLVDFEDYKLACNAITDESQMKVAYVARNFDDMEMLLKDALGPDSLGKARTAYVESILREIGNPGEATVATIKKLLFS